MKFPRIFPSLKDKGREGQTQLGLPRRQRPRPRSAAQSKPPSSWIFIMKKKGERRGGAVAVSRDDVAVALLPGCVKKCSC